MKVYVWGTGKKSSELIKNRMIELESIASFIETEKSNDFFMGKNIISLRELDEYDYIVVSIKNSDMIYELCTMHNIDISKICFVYPCFHENDSEKNVGIAKKVLTNDGYSFVCENYHIKDISWIKRDAEKYTSLNTHSSFEVIEDYNYYITSDKYEDAGEISSYFWQDLWAAKRIISNKPTMHYDIGSRVDGFIAHLLAADIEVNLIDIRPLNLGIDKLTFTCVDATNMGEIEDNSIESLSALCSLEHFGLGRYGDPIDPDACFKCFDAIQRKVKTDGEIFISVPIGKEHLEFNAHRVFCASTVVSCFKDCKLIEFSSTKNECFEENISLNKFDNDMSLGGSRLGLFHFVKM